MSNNDNQIKHPALVRLTAYVISAVIALIIIAFCQPLISDLLTGWGTSHSVISIVNSIFAILIFAISFIVAERYLGSHYGMGPFNKNE